MQPTPYAPERHRPLSRPMALGTHGVVSTGHPLATQVGLRVLEEGGTAVDAALAAGAVLAVVLPEANTIGGDLFALVHDGASGEVVAVNASCFRNLPSCANICTRRYSRSATYTVPSCATRIA